MALRPVSELGLVEVTDVATPAAVSQPVRKPPRSRSAEGDGPIVPSPRPARTAMIAGSRAPGVVTSVLSGAIGVAGAVLVGRAILRR